MKYECSVCGINCKLETDGTPNGLMNRCVLGFDWDANWVIE